MRPCVASITRLSFLMKCKLVIGPVKFFSTTKCCANVMSQLSKLDVVVANGFYNWPFATRI